MAIVFPEPKVPAADDALLVAHIGNIDGPNVLVFNDGGLIHVPEPLVSAYHVQHDERGVSITDYKASVKRGFFLRFFENTARHAREGIERLLMHHALMERDEDEVLRVPDLTEEQQGYSYEIEYAMDGYTIRKRVTAPTRNELLELIEKLSPESVQKDDPACPPGCDCPGCRESHIAKVSDGEAMCEPGCTVSGSAEMWTAGKDWKDKEQLVFEAIRKRHTLTQEQTKAVRAVRAEKMKAEKYAVEKWVEIDGVRTRKARVNLPAGLHTVNLSWMDPRRGCSYSVPFEREGFIEWEQDTLLCCYPFSGPGGRVVFGLINHAGVYERCDGAVSLFELMGAVFPSDAAMPKREETKDSAGIYHEADVVIDRFCARNRWNTDDAIPITVDPARITVMEVNNAVVPESDPDEDDEDDPEAIDEPTEIFESWRQRDPLL